MGYGDGFRVFTGIFEIIGAILLLVGIWVENLALIGAMMIVLAMIGVIFTHIKIKDTVKNMMKPFVLSASRQKTPSSIMCRCVNTEDK